MSAGSGPRRGLASIGLCGLSRLRVFPSLAATRHRYRHTLYSTNTHVWVPLSEQMAGLWAFPSPQTKRDYVLSAGGAQVVHIEAKHKWRRFAVDLDTFLERINRGDWEDTRRDGPNKELAVLLWGAQEANCKRAALIDEKRLLIFERDGEWRLAREVDLFVDPIERVYAAFMLLAPP